MTDRQISILGTLATIFFGVLAGVVAAVCDSNQRPYWIAVFVSLASLSLLYIIVRAVYIRLRGVHFVSDFGAYCDGCRLMLRDTTDHDEVWTIQTPVPDAIVSPRYRQYITYTTNRLISSEFSYHRLVVLRRGDAEPVMSIKEFLAELIRAAVARERLEAGSETPRHFNLANVYVGFVDEECFPGSIYSNLDIHVTTATRFAIAFLGEAPKGQESFGASLHLREHAGRVNRRLRAEMRALWAAIGPDKVLAVGHYYPAYTGGQAKTGRDERQVIAALDAAVDHLAEQLVAPP